MATRSFFVSIAVFGLVLVSTADAQRPPVRTPFRRLPPLEQLNRGVVAVNSSALETFISWRMFGTDPQDIAFNVYCITAGATPEKLNSEPITDRTCFQHVAGVPWVDRKYYVRPVYNGQELAASEMFTLPANTPVQQYLRVPLDRPAGGTSPSGVNYTYKANDCSVGDVDGDGEYEIFVKWDPTNSQDNAHSGYTGNVYIDCYKLNGTKLWRIDLGRNIRAGAHYTQFMVFDFDGDGKAEMMCKTADATRDGVGTYIGNSAADHRNSSGYILAGPEYLSVFEGATGKVLATTNYIPPRHPTTLTPSGSQINAIWGDNYGNRVDRFLACVAYLDGIQPSAVFCRGYYSRTTLTAWDWRDGKLTMRWAFDTRNPSNPVSGNYAPGYNGSWEEMGNHQLSVADVDADGKDEILYGAIAINDNGQGMYTTTLAHGDAYHVSDMDPDRPGLEVFGPHENPIRYGAYGIEMHDARTGAIIWGATGNNNDVGRGVAMDIDPRYKGYEAWGSRPAAGGLYSCKGELISLARPSNMNFGVWWDGDLLREILDGSNNDSTSTPPVIRKWNWNTSTTSTIFTATDCFSNNNTKATPNLCADFLGDWREEVIWRKNDNTELRIFTTTIPTSHRIYTLMHDRQYREAIAWQNVAYNQPPHPSFYLGEGMTLPLPRLYSTTP